MTAEYLTITTADPPDAELNAKAAEGWTVKASYSPTSHLLERRPVIPAIVPRAEPQPPTGPSRTMEGRL